jgi:hypothetical protein
MVKPAFEPETALLGIGLTDIQPGQTLPIPIYPQITLRIDELFLIGPGLMLNDIRVGLQSVFGGSSGDAAVELYSQHREDGFRGRKVKWPLCQVGQNIVFHVHNPTNKPVLFSGGMIATAIARGL